MQASDALFCLLHRQQINCINHGKNHRSHRANPPRIVYFLFKKSSISSSSRFGVHRRRPSSLPIWDRLHHLTFLLQGELRHVILLRSLRRSDPRSRFGIPIVSESPTLNDLRSRRLAAVSMRALLRGGRMTMARVRFATLLHVLGTCFSEETASRRLHASLLWAVRMTMARVRLAAFLRVFGHMLQATQASQAASATFSI